MPAPEPTPSQPARATRAFALPAPGARRAAVIGAGSFGTALAVLLARAGLRTTLHARTAEQAAELARERENRVYSPAWGRRAPRGLGPGPPAPGAPATPFSPLPR